MKHLRKALPLLTSVALVLVLGAVAASGHLTTAHRVDHAQRADRQHLQETLAGLTNQYLQFAFLDTLRAADSVRWTLRPDDSADRLGLQRAVGSSPLTSYGATLVSTTGLPLTSYAPRGLPSPLDPGLRPLRTALAQGRPGLSNVLHVKDAALVAFAVPVRRSGSVVAILLAYADVRTWPLQGYDAMIRLGPSAEPFVLDAGGVVSAAGTVTSVGQRLAGLPAVVTAGGSGILTVSRDHVSQVVSYAPAGHGWTALTVQDAADFSGGLQSRSQRDAVAVVVLLTVVVLLLVWFNHTRQRALRHLADERLHDPLTGLAQRRLFDLRLQAALARQRRTGAPLSLVYGDLDDFKAVNDTFGHNTGDQLLVAVAERIREATRDDDFVARMGGDEFALVLEGSDLEETCAVVERLREAVGKGVELRSGHVLRPRISVGAAVLRDPSRAEDLVVEADMAMYRVKRGVGTESVVVLEAGGGLVEVVPSPRAGDVRAAAASRPWR